MIALEDLGYNAKLEDYRKEQNFDSFEVGRVISEHKEKYVVKTDKMDLDAEIIGNLTRIIHRLTFIQSTT